jgi:hypothetical protein
VLALCSNPQPGGVSILVAFYDMHELQWDYSFPRSPYGELRIRCTLILPDIQWIYNLSLYYNFDYNSITRHGNVLLSLSNINQNHA